MNFRKYQHVERFGTTEVRDIEIGECYVFPKIDGTNASAWLNDEGEICGGSRNRALSLDNDNAGYYNWLVQQENIIRYLKKNPTHRLFGEWLVPHSLKTYRQDAWRRFYVFDVAVDNDGDGNEYIPYSIYQPLLEEFGIDYIPPIKIIKNGSYDDFIFQMTNNNIFLIEDGKGVGEGIVIKNYDFYNRHGRQTWAKIVTSEFKEKHTKKMGAPKDEHILLEEKIASEYVTEALVEKEYAKIVNEKGGWESKFIPMLLGIVWNCIITEEMWNIVKKYKNPTISFKTLNAFVINRIKEIKKEIF